MATIGELVYNSLEQCFIEYQYQSYIRQHPQVDINTYYSQVYEGSFLQFNFAAKYKPQLCDDVQRENKRATAGYK